MPITPFSIFLIGILIYGLFRQKNLQRYFEFLVIVSISCMLNIHMGYFLKLGNSTLSYSSMLVYLTAAVGVVVLLQLRKVPVKLTKTVVVFLAVLVCNYALFTFHMYQKPVIADNWTDYVLGKDVYSYLTPSSLQIGYYLMFTCVGIILICAKKIFTEKQFIKTLQTVLNISKLSIILGYVELIAKNLFHSLVTVKLCIGVFGTSGAQQDWLSDRGNLYTIQGATKEASMYTTVIFYIAILFLLEMVINKKAKKKDAVWLFLCILILCLNPAMSTVLYLAILFVVVVSSGMINVRILRWNNKKFVFSLLALVLVAVCGAVYLIQSYNTLLSSDIYMIQRLGRAVQQLLTIVEGGQNLVYSSEAIRFSGIIYDLKLWLQRPIFGLGLGTVLCNSGIVTFLCNAGLSGVICWFLVLCRFSNMSGETLRNAVFVAELWLLPSLILNDYETILGLVIPFSCILYGYVCKNQKRFKHRDSAE